MRRVSRTAFFTTIVSRHITWRSPSQFTDDLLVQIVIHTASALDFAFAKNLIIALGKQREASGKDTHFVHVSQQLNLNADMR
jgi:hypothetical protein